MCGIAGIIAARGERPDPAALEARWFRGELRPLLRDNLSASDARSLAFLRRDAVERLVKEHDSGSRDHGNRLWALLMLELWQRRFLS